VAVSDAVAFPEVADIETASDDYARRFSGAVGVWMLGIQEGTVLDRLRPYPGATVLDVGGGHGQLAGPLCRAQYPVTVTGSDETCRKRVEPWVQSGVCQFVKANVLALPFDDRSFDTVLCFRLVTHCERWPDLVRELCRVARRSVLIDYPTCQSLNWGASLLFGAKKKLEGNTRIFRLFRHAEIADALGRQGFEVRFRTGQFFWPMVLHRVLRCVPASRALEGVPRALGLCQAWGSPVILEADRRVSEM